MIEDPKNKNNDISMNTSLKQLFCNHCSFEFKGKDDMREHYKSQFHLYNLHRVTMNLNPVGYEEYLAKKELLEKKKATKQVKVTVEQNISNYCNVCFKSFASFKKMNEHLSSKTHKFQVEKFKESELNNDNKEVKDKKPVLTAENDPLICFVCNEHQESTDKLLLHLKEKHSFEFPLISCITKIDKAFKLVIKKIFKYGACLYCDSQKFVNVKAIQTHMRDKGHCKINYEDIIEHFYKYYDKKKLLELTGPERKTKEFKLLKRVIVPKQVEEVEEVSDIEAVGEIVELAPEEVEDAVKDINYVELDNGELMLKDGKILGNKIYKNVYKQRIKIQAAWKETAQVSLMRIKAKSAHRKLNRLVGKKKLFSHWNVTGSKKSNFTRINTLFKARKQVNV